MSLGPVLLLGKNIGVINQLTCISQSLAGWIIQSRDIGQATKIVNNIPPTRIFWKLSLRSFQWYKITWKKCWSQLQIISKCYMYFLQFLKIMKFQKMLLTKIQNSVQNVFIVTHGPCDILNYYYEIFICEISLWNLQVLICTHFMHCINNVKSLHFVWFCFTRWKYCLIQFITFTKKQVMVIQCTFLASKSNSIHHFLK